MFEIICPLLYRRIAKYTFLYYNYSKIRKGE